MTHDVLEPAGPLAGHIARLFWVFVIITSTVYLIVIGFLVRALRRRAKEAGGRPPPDTGGDPPRALRAIGIAAGLTAVILVVLAISDFVGNRALAAVPSDAMRVRVTAHQWWWEVEYIDATPARRLRTANELHIPVGRPVLLELRSSDVIHSFWVPNLQGKKDLLPGYATTLVLQASRPGLYTGECAEFCGFQHANMRLDVHARAPAEFSRWQEAQLAPAPEPTGELERRGREVFLGSSCEMCHAV